MLLLLYSGTELKQSLGHLLIRRFQNVDQPGLCVSKSTQRESVIMLPVKVLGKPRYSPTRLCLISLCEQCYCMSVSPSTASPKKECDQLENEPPMDYDDPTGQFGARSPQQ